MDGVRHTPHRIQGTAVVVMVAPPSATATRCHSDSPIIRHDYGSYARR